MATKVQDRNEMWHQYCVSKKLIPFIIDFSEIDRTAKVRSSSFEVNINIKKKEWDLGAKFKLGVTNYILTKPLILNSDSEWYIVALSTLQETIFNFLLHTHTHTKTEVTQWGMRRHRRYRVPLSVITWFLRKKTPETCGFTRNSRYCFGIKNLKWRVWKIICHESSYATQGIFLYLLGRWRPGSSTLSLQIQLFVERVSWKSAFSAINTLKSWHLKHPFH